jgi:flavin-dependent dehydrogenase
MDPLLGFGISGALVTGKVAALAIKDRDAAESEFRRFNRHFKASYYAKRLLWSRFIRPNVGAIALAINLFGVKRAERLGNYFAAGHLHVRGAIPGFGPISCS